MKHICMVLISMLLVVACFTVGVSPVEQAFADNSSVLLAYDNTFLLDDLSELTIDGKLFDVADYVADTDGELKLIFLTEYCYSYYATSMQFYSIYLYIYNPAQININEISALNKVQIATAFDTDGNATSYSKFLLRFCNRTDNKVLYKFKVQSSHEVLEFVKAYASVHDGVRRYAVGEIELNTLGDYNATSYAVGQRFDYTGFAQGYGLGTNSTLELSVSSLDVLELEVHSAFYRPSGVNELGSRMQDQLNSVYFAVPNKYLRKYGEMYSVHVEWYEYLTKEILVLSNEDVYRKFKEAIGRVIDPFDSDIGYGFAAEFVTLSLSAYATLVYNSEFPFLPNGVDSVEYLNALYYVFSSEGQSALDYSVSSEKLIEYMTAYSKTNNSYEINDKFSKDLFCDYVDEGRLRGYNEYTITKTDGFPLTSHVLDKQSWWEKLFGIKNYSKVTYEDIEGIKALSGSDFNGSAEDVCNRLYIDSSNYSDLKTFYDSASKKDSTVFLLRFAVTDYYSTPVNIIQDKFFLGHINTIANISSDAYLARETVFLDFDVIDVTFYKDSTYTVIPVAASPIDIIAPITPPVGMFEIGCDSFDLVSIICVFLVFLLLIILLKLLRVLFFPFRVLKRSVKKYKKK